jgi:hypothetical protein
MYRWTLKIVTKKEKNQSLDSTCENEIKKTMTIEVGAWHEIMAFIEAKKDEHIATLDKIDPRD